MQIDTQIKALRGDLTAQRAMREAVADAVASCRKDPGIQQLLDGLERYGSGLPLEDCPALYHLTVNKGAAQKVLAPLIDKLVTLHRKEPLAQLPFRHQAKDGFHFLQLAAKGRASLGLSLHDAGAAVAANDTATFSDAERHEIVIAGAADVEMVDIVTEQAGKASFARRTIVAGAGVCLSFANRLASRVVQKVHGRFLVLRLARVAEQPLPTLQYDLHSGRLLHRASGDIRESRHEMMVSLLCRMGRTDAAPVLQAMTRSGSDHLRWQALREVLALDTAAGFASLCSVARDRSDPLASSAASLRARLVQTHPQLELLEPVQCPT